jgi:protein-tyrosine phosphatase
MALYRILFVCLGNICRSPLAEGIFLHLVQERELLGRYLAESAGIGDWHCGEPPDPRARAAAERRGVRLLSVCRQVQAGDFGTFDLILPMDRSNREQLLARSPVPHRGKIRLMREFDPEAAPGSHPEVPDPYHGDAGGFDRVFEMLHRSCGALLDRLESDPAALGRDAGGRPPGKDPSHGPGPRA